MMSPVPSRGGQRAMILFEDFHSHVNKQSAPVNITSKIFKNPKIDQLLNFLRLLSTKEANKRVLSLASLSNLVKWLKVKPEFTLDGCTRGSQKFYNILTPDLKLDVTPANGGRQTYPKC